MKLSSSNIKKLLIFSQKKIFSYISGNETFLKKLPILQEGNFRVRKIRKDRSEKISYIFSKKLFLYFEKRDFLIFLEMELYSLKNKIFQEVTLQAQKIKKTTPKKFLIFREMELFSPKIINAGVILTRQKFTRSLINADEMFFQAKTYVTKP